MLVLIVIGMNELLRLIDPGLAAGDLDGDGRADLFIGATDEESARKAIDIIEGMTKDVEVGQIYTGKVVKVPDAETVVVLVNGERERVRLFGVRAPAGVVGAAALGYFLHRTTDAALPYGV